MYQLVYQVDVSDTQRYCVRPKVHAGPYQSITKKPIQHSTEKRVPFWCKWYQFEHFVRNVSNDLVKSMIQHIEGNMKAGLNYHLEIMKLVNNNIKIMRLTSSI